MSAAGSSLAVGKGSQPPHFRWNFAWFSIEYVLFQVAMAFLSQSTVLPSFVSQLTESAMLVGLITTVQSGAWLLPQLFAASLVAGHVRKRPFMLWSALASRPAILLLAGLTLGLGADQPGLLLVAFYLSLALFNFPDSLTAVSWWDIFAKAIPASARGRLLGAGQIAGGVVGVAIGGLVALILGRPDLAFPMNYGIIFGLAGLAFAFELVSLAMIREPVGPAGGETRSLGQFFRLIVPTLRGDRDLRQVVATRLLYGTAVLVFPFYIVFARRELGFGAEDVGLFLSAQVLGGMFGGLLFGQLSDRRGTRLAIRVAIGLAMLSPVTALLAHVFGSAMGPALLYVTALSFVGIGLAFSAYTLGFMGHILEIAPSAERATYTGLYNTINGSLLLVPALAGSFLEATSFAALFAAALGFLAVAGIASLGLGEPRRR